MKKVVRIDFAKFWNSEHPRVYNRLTGIVEKHNPETLHLAGPLARVKTHLPQLIKIEVQERGSVITVKLEELDLRNDNIIRGMIRLTNGFLTVDMASTYESAVIVKAWLDKHKASSIPDDNYTAAGERLSDMIADAERTPAIMAALQKLNLIELLTELKTNTEQFETFFMQRKEDKSVTEIVDVKAIRIAADKDMRRLFRFIELYQLEYPEADYAPLVKELNTLLSYYKTQLAARATRRAKGIKVEEEQPIDEPEGEE